MEILPKDPFLVRFFGRVGTGLGTAGRVLAEAARRENYHVQAFAEFPLKYPDEAASFSVVLSRFPLYAHRWEDPATAVVLLDLTLTENPNFSLKVDKGGWVMINTAKSVREISKVLPLSAKISSFNASEVAVYFLGENLPNLVILAAALKTCPLVKVETLAMAVKDLFEETWSSQVVDKNIIALKMGYNEMEVEVSRKSIKS